MSQALSNITAEIILHKILEEHAAIKAVLHQKHPLEIKVIKEALDNKQREATSSTSGLVPTIKQVTAYKADRNWATCKPGWHNQATKHSAKESMTVQEDQSNQSDGLSTNTAGAFISIRHTLKASFNTSEGTFDISNSSDNY
ncbi:hypothetical protein VP01_2078g1 [Puccinia sorghi]|uniref:Uncharacterized protein n=1 Tax=Puccinia sorghi TaxID=27349 RepID=A0A0L6VAE6_9BASI|nr:hypothetical protein VP01_2078g1 [Puccinia sorghi]